MRLGVFLQECNRLSVHVPSLLLSTCRTTCVIWCVVWWFLKAVAAKPVWAALVRFFFSSSCHQRPWQRSSCASLSWASLLVRSARRLTLWCAAAARSALPETSAGPPEPWSSGPGSRRPAAAASSYAHREQQPLRHLICLSDPLNDAPSSVRHLPRNKKVARADWLWCHASIDMIAEVQTLWQAAMSMDRRYSCTDLLRLVSKPFHLIGWIESFDAQNLYEGYIEKPVT